MSELTDNTRLAVMSIYKRKGLAATDKKIMELLQQCEHSKYSAHDRGAIKGELSENALECHIMRLMRLVPNIACVKSLCMKALDNNSTAEIDILMVTPYRIYLFECKSFKGPKVLSKECYLKGGSSEKDVYDQSLYHLKILNQHLAEFRQRPKDKLSPYKLVLFELSTDSINDTRTDKWKREIPLLTLNTLDAWLVDELSKERQVMWDMQGVLAKLKDLNSKSGDMFKFHMHKIMNRKK